MVFVKVNGWEDTLITQEWGVVGFPTLVLTNHDGTEIDRFAGFAQPQEFVTMMNDYMAGRGTLDDLLRRQAQHPDSLWLALRIGEKYQYRDQAQQAESCYVAFLQLDPQNKSGMADSVLHSLARVAYVAGEARYDTAAARFAALIERYPESPLAEDAATWVPYIYAKLGRNAEALKRYERFLVDYPESAEADWVRIQIADLKEQGE